MRRCSKARRLEFVVQRSGEAKLQLQNMSKKVAGPPC
jgi:hypothetical protein